MGRELWLGPRRLAGALAAGGEDVLSVVATTAVAGVIVGVVTLTGLGLKVVRRLARPVVRWGTVQFFWRSLTGELPEPAESDIRVREAFESDLAEIRGGLNQALRRLERLEQELLAERNARIEDLAILVDLVSSGWSGVDQRLRKLEAGIQGPVVPFRAEREDATLPASAEADAA